MNAFVFSLAQSTNVAEILLWEVGSWTAVGRLQSHTLTITQLKFCHDDALLLQSHGTVSYLFSPSIKPHFILFLVMITSCIFCVNSDGIDYKLFAKHEAHKRIIRALMEPM